MIGGLDHPNVIALHEVCIDARTEKLIWSDEAFRLTGRDPDLGVPSPDESFSMIHEDDCDVLRQTINAALASGRGYDLVVRQLRADGNHREVLLKGQPIVDAEGYTIELYGVMIPIPD